jgi:cytochrome c oxidase subunit 2
MLDLFKLPLLASKEGADVDMLIKYVHLLMLALFVGWAAYFLYAVFRFRQKRNPKADYLGVTNHASNYIELAVVVVEGLLLFAFAIPLWAHAVDKFPEEKDSTVVRITGRQFNWIARYPGADGKFGSNRVDLVSAENAMGVDKSDPAAKDDVVVESSEVVVPVNKPVIAHISSLDVIHSFKVVPLRITQDANPGMSIPVHFTPTETNTYQIQCSQLCGNGHYSMKGIFKVLSQPDYDAWVKSKSGTNAAPPANYE